MSLVARRKKMSAAKSQAERNKKTLKSVNQIQQDKGRAICLEMPAIISDFVAHFLFRGPKWPALSPYLSCAPKPA
jgi:hypothetical protein